MTPPIWFFRYFRSSKIRLEAIDKTTVEEIKMATARYFAVLDFLVKQDLVSDSYKRAFVNDMNASNEIRKDLENRFKIFSDPNVRATSNTLFERLASQGYRVNNIIVRRGPSCGSLFN